MNEEFLTNLIKEDNFLTVHKNGNVFIRGNQLNKEQRAELKDSAVNFKDSFIWKLLSQEIRNESVNSLYKAKNEKELIAGQIMIYNLEIMENLLKKLSSL